VRLLDCLPVVFVVSVFSLSAKLVFFYLFEDGIGRDVLWRVG
jgi:hypothetical protein